MSLKHKKWHIFVFIDLMFRVSGPPLLLNFIFFQAVAGFISAHFLGESDWYAVGTALLNSADAEVLMNVHAFNTIVTKHAGTNLWHFQDPCLTDTAEFYLRAVLGSAAYQAGKDYIDNFHGNPTVKQNPTPSLRSRLHPRFKAVCGVPYIQEPFWVRTMKRMSVIVGTSTHQKLMGQTTEKPELCMSNDFKIRSGCVNRGATGNLAT